LVAWLTARLRVELPNLSPEAPAAIVVGVWPQPLVEVALQVAPSNTETRSGPLLVRVAT
jgi:hypothetical protein